MLLEACFCGWAFWHDLGDDKSEALGQSGLGAEVGAWLAGDDAEEWCRPHLRTRAVFGTTVMVFVFALGFGLALVLRFVFLFILILRFVLAIGLADFFTRRRRRGLLRSEAGGQAQEGGG